MVVLLDPFTIGSSKQEAVDGQRGFGWCGLSRDGWMTLTGKPTLGDSEDAEEQGEEQEYEGAWIEKDDPEESEEDECARED